jgi:hypothetical protein
LDSTSTATKATSVNQAHPTPAPTKTQTSTAGTTSSLVKLSYGLQPVDKSGLTGVAYHFINNELLGLAIFPVNFTVLSNSQQVAQPVWDLSVSRPIWKMELSTENVLLLIVNLFVIAIGVLALISKTGVLGIIPLLMQIGYHLGNAFAKTSGARYLQPVNWVSYLYFATGVIAIVIFLLNLFRNEKLPSFSPAVWKVDFSKIPLQQPQKLFSKGWMITCAGVLLAGMILPVMNNLPNRLPPETSDALVDSVGSQLTEKGFVTTENGSFLKSPNHLIVEGSAYHPQYYRSNFYERAVRI